MTFTALIMWLPFILITSSAFFVLGVAIGMIESKLRTTRLGTALKNFLKK